MAFGLSACGGGGGGGHHANPAAAPRRRQLRPDADTHSDPDPDADANTQLQHRRPLRRRHQRPLRRPPPHRHQRRRRLRPTDALRYAPNIARRTTRSPPDAISAYNAGATGEGVKIGIVDSGINPDLAEFTGRIDPGQRRCRRQSRRQRRGRSRHGGQRRRGRRTQQYRHAWVSRSTRPSSACAPTIPVPARPTDGCNFNDDAIASGSTPRGSAGAKVINLSLGGSAPGTNVARRDAARGQRRHRPRHLGRQRRRPPNPDPFALTPAAAIRGMVVIAGSVGVQAPNGTIDTSRISGFSNRAGTGAQWYLTAVGYQRPRARPDGQAIPVGRGPASPRRRSPARSRCSPRHSPTSPASQIVEILFNSADDLGAAGRRFDLRTRAAEHRPRLPADRCDKPGRQPDAGQPVDNGDLPEAAGDADTDAVARRDHPRRLQPRLCPQPREDASTRRRSDSPLARALQQRHPGGQRQRRAAEHRHDGPRAARLAQGFELERMRHRSRRHAQVAARRRLGGRPDRRQDRRRFRLRRRRQGDGAAAQRGRAAAPS